MSITTDEPNGRHAVSEKTETTKYPMTGILAKVDQKTSKAGNPYAVLFVRRDDGPMVPALAVGKPLQNFLDSGIKVGEPIRVLGEFKKDPSGKPQMTRIETAEYGQIETQSFQAVWVGKPRPKTAQAETAQAEPEPAGTEII
jgi:hypothetical protein